MTRRPRKVKTVRTVSRKDRSKGRKVAKPAKPKRDPVDDLVAAGARALDLRIDKAWMPAVRGHLQVTLRRVRRNRRWLPDGTSWMEGSSHSLEQIATFTSQNRVTTNRVKR